jgi:serine/threonine kinase 38
MSIHDFQTLAIIGRGAFGEVILCRSKEGEIVAIKKMNKNEMITKFQVILK